MRTKLLNIQINQQRDGADIQAEPTLKSRLIGFLQVLTVVVLITAAVLFAREDKQAIPVADNRPTADAAASPLLVTTIQPQLVPSKLLVRTTASVVVRNYVSLVSEVTGRVQSLSPQLRAGGRFAANETVLTIDPRDFKLGAAQANADVRTAQANLELLRAQSEAAIANYGLLHGNKQVPPLVAKQPQIAQGQAQLLGAQARADMAQLDLTRTTLAMPFAGRVVESTAEVGQLLNRGQAFGRVFATDAIEIVVPLSSKEAQKLQPLISRKASVQVDGQTLTARVTRQSAELDERTRFTRVYLSLDDQQLLPPGAFVEAIIDGPSVAETFRLPIAAQQSGDALWVVRQGKLSSVQPRLLDQSAREIVVAAFDAGDGVVLGAVPGASEGLAVRVSAER